MFTPLHIIPIMNSGPNIPIGIDSSDPETLFRLFFDDSVLDRLVHCTNNNAAINTVKESSERAWKLVNRDDILSYLGVLVWSGLNSSSWCQNYWYIATDAPVHEAIRSSVSRQRWKAIHRYFHIWETTEADSGSQYQKKAYPHEKVEPLAQVLRQNFKKYFNPCRCR
jgi:hypothetical protein